MGNWLHRIRSREDFSGVVVPLADSPAPATNAESGSDDEPKEKDKDLGTAPSQENGAAPMPPKHMLTIEALRSEVESVVGASGHDSVYDRMSHVTSTAMADFLSRNCFPASQSLLSISPYAALLAVDEGTMMANIGQRRDRQG